MSRREYGVRTGDHYILDMHGRPLTRWQAKKLARRLHGAVIRGVNL